MYYVFRVFCVSAGVFLGFRGLNRIPEVRDYLLVPALYPLVPHILMFLHNLDYPTHAVAILVQPCEI